MESGYGGVNEKLRAETVTKSDRYLVTSRLPSQVMAEIVYYWFVLEHLAVRRVLLCGPITPHQCCIVYLEVLNISVDILSRHLNRHEGTTMSCSTTFLR
jgi:hypothetical protein